MIDMQVLRRFPCFSELDQNMLAKLAAITTQKTFPADTELCRRGEEAKTLYLVVRGRVRIEYPLPTGKTLCIQTMRDGDILVWSSVITPYETTATATATQETIVLAIDAVQLREFFDQDPGLGYLLTNQIAKMLAERLETARVKFASLLEHLDDLLVHSKE